MAGARCSEVKKKKRERERERERREKEKEEGEEIPEARRKLLKNRSTIFLRGVLLKATPGAS